MEITYVKKSRCWQSLWYLMSLVYSILLQVVCLTPAVSRNTLWKFLSKQDRVSDVSRLTALLLSFMYSYLQLIVGYIESYRITFVTSSLWLKDETMTFWFTANFDSPCTVYSMGACGHRSSVITKARKICIMYMRILYLFYCTFSIYLHIFAYSMTYWKILMFEASLQERNPLFS